MAYSNIDKPNKYFNTIAYAGAGGTQSVTGTGFQPDFVWIKNRSITADHMLYDAVRGTGASKAITSDNIDQEGLGTNVGSPTQYGYLSAFGSDGFTVVAGSSNGNFVNTSGNNFVSWNWLGANTTVSNTSGTRTSTVSANTTSGFSIVSYTGNSTAGATIGHGLGVKPSMIIVKQRSGDVAEPVVYHTSTGATKFFKLNATNAVATNSTLWNNTEPTSTLFTVGTAAVTNASFPMIAYCFAEVKGFSKAFSYTGNGSTDGTFVYCGFRPAWILIKKSDGAVQNWVMHDSKRSTFNLSQNKLFANLSDAEGTDATYYNLDILSNGFKLRSSNSDVNSSGGAYIGIAFAENPVTSSKGIPCTAR